MSKVNYKMVRPRITEWLTLFLLHTGKHKKLCTEQ